MSLSFPEMLLTASDLDDRRTCASWDIVCVCVWGGEKLEYGVSLGEVASPWTETVCPGGELPTAAAASKGPKRTRARPLVAVSCKGI